MRFPCEVFLGRYWFAVLWSFIGFVSLVDSFLVVRFSDVILEVEENPVGSYLLTVNDGHPGLFLRTKAAGTLLVLSALVGLYRYRQCWAFPVTGSVAFFQGWLLLYLASGMPTKSETFTDIGSSRFSPGYDITQPVRSGEGRSTIGRAAPL